MKTYKAIGALLDYPQEDMLDALDDILRLVSSEPGVPALVRTRIEQMADYLWAGDLIFLQERYVETFDRSRRTSLHLYEHVHGEGRDRGMAMVNLAEMYRLHGFELARPELPDYLPLLCEFLSQVPDKVAISILADATDILEAVRRRLVDKESPYAALLEALVHLTGRSVNPAEVDAIMNAEPPEPQSNEELDAAWAEDPITFGAGAALGDVQGTCPNARTRPPESPTHQSPVRIQPLEG